MDERPEWVTCVSDPERRQYSCCGRYVGGMFAFESWEHAGAAVKSGSRLTVCPECAATRAKGA